MTHALTADQVEQVINNTVIVLLSRPDLLQEWHAALFDLMKQAQNAALDDEAIFIAAVLTLLHHPDYSLPTGTTYDRAWQTLVVGLQTGMIQAGEADGDAMTMDRLLGAVVQAATVVLTHPSAARDDVKIELNQMRAAASEIGDPELTIWLDDVLALLDGTLDATHIRRHKDIYAGYWNILAQNIGRKDLFIGGSEADS